MAERRSSSRQRRTNSSSDHKGSSGTRAQRGSARKRLTGREAIEQVRRDLPELLGRPIEQVIGLQSDDSGWKVTVQVIELARIPNSTDVLGAYEVALDREGELTSWRRTRRFNRGQADED